jgi:transposase
LSVEEKTRLVLAVLAGEMTMVEAVHRHGTSPRVIGQWRDRFIDAGKASLESRLPGGPDRGGTQDERRLRAEAE